MNQKTEPSSEVPRPVRRWLIVLALLTLVLVFSTERHHERQVQITTGFEFTLYPWLHAAALTISNGLDLFSGQPLSPPTTGQRLSMLVGVLLSLVIAPTFLFFGWRHSVRSKLAGVSPSPFMILLLLIGGALTVAVSFPSIPFAVENIAAYTKTREVQDLAAHRDILIDRLNLVARDARQYRILPSSAGGGNGSFKGFSITEKLRSSEDGSFEVAEATADSLILRAISRQRAAFVTKLSMNASGRVLYFFEGY